MLKVHTHGALSSAQHDLNRRDEEEEVSGLIPKTPVSLATITCVFGHVCQQGLHPRCIEIPAQMCHHMLFILSVKSATWSTQPRHYLWMETFWNQCYLHGNTALNSTHGGRLLGIVRLIEIEFSEWLESSRVVVRRVQWSQTCHSLPRPAQLTIFLYCGVSLNSEGSQEFFGRFGPTTS